MEIMTKLTTNEKLTEFAGCIATGKEANVYLGHGSYDFEKRKPLEYDEDFEVPVRDYAIKIFKTSVCTFKDRERYVAGEFRFRHGGYKKNPRKMIQMWAEKEVRNLKRIALTCDGLIKSPWPHFLKNNVIVMDFIGHIESRPTMPTLDGEEEKDVPHETRHKAAPRLRDAHVEDWVNAYEQTLLIIRRLYQKCKLIHADLSEYNLLYFEEIVYVIDVSQSVEHDHPMSLDFLRRDCSIIRDFFSKKLQRVVTTEQMFNFTVDFTIKEEDEEETMQDLIKKATEMTIEEYAAAEYQDEVFKEMYIPRTLHEISIEDIVRMQRDGMEIAFDKLSGLKINKEEAEKKILLRKKQIEKDAEPEVKEEAPKEESKKTKVKVVEPE